MPGIKPMILTQEEMLQRLRSYVFECGTQAEAARKLGISAPYLNDILQKKRGISKDVANKFGYDVVYSPKE